MCFSLVSPYQHNAIHQCVSEFCLCSVHICIFRNVFFISLFSICFLDAVWSAGSWYFNYTELKNTQLFRNQYFWVIVRRHFTNGLSFIFETVHFIGIYSQNCGSCAKHILHLLQVSRNPAAQHNKVSSKLTRGF